MLRACRTDYLIRVLVVTAMVWGFALPIAHLACGMMMDSEVIPCDDHALMDDASSDAGHAGPEHAGIHPREDEGPALHLHNGIASPAHQVHPANAAVQAHPAHVAHQAHPAHAAVQAHPAHAAVQAHPAHAAVQAHPAHAAVQAVGHDAARYGTDIPHPTAEVETDDVRVECCWVDANAADRRAPLPTLTQLPNLAAALTGVAPSIDVPEVRAIDRTSEAVSTPPIAFRLLFSVFLI